MENVGYEVRLRGDIRHFKSQIKITELKLDNLQIRKELKRLQDEFEKVNRAALIARAELEVFHPDYDNSRIKEIFESVFTDRSMFDMINRAGGFSEVP